jgi:F-type H+-transporting ATPase subunit b
MDIFQLNATLVAELALFAIVVAVVAKIVLPPLRRAMTERQATIRKGLADAQAAEARLDAAEAEYERRLAAARREGRMILDSYQAMAKQAAQDARPDRPRIPTVPQVTARASAGGSLGAAAHSTGDRLVSSARSSGRAGAGEPVSSAVQPG